MMTQITDDLEAEIAKTAALANENFMRAKRAEAEIERLRAVNDRQDDVIDRLATALQRIESWSRVYPLTVFPEPDFEKAAELLKAGGITLDAVAASCMRRAMEGVEKIAADALHYE